MACRFDPGSGHHHQIVSRPSHAEINKPAAGEPLILPLNVISCDPNQPSKHFDEPALAELVDSILAVGVVQPSSLRPNPAAAGRYIISYCERRYRAPLVAGIATIPVFVHKAPDDYRQVAENLLRADVSPMEIALFIKRRLDAGKKKNEIAAKLGHKNGNVTEHLALLEASPCIEKAYANGATSARTLYDLRRLHDEFAQEVNAWCASGVEVTRDTVAALVQKFRRDEITDDSRSAQALPVRTPHPRYTCSHLQETMPRRLHRRKGVRFPPRLDTTSMPSRQHLPDRLPYDFSSRR